VSRSVSAHGKGLKESPLAPRFRAVWPVLVVSLIMLGAATLASAGSVTPGSSASGGAGPPPTPSILAGSSVAGTPGQVFTITVSGSTSGAQSPPLAPPSNTSSVAGAQAASTVGFAGSGPHRAAVAPSLDADPHGSCAAGCTATNWFGGSLAITTGAVNDLLVLEITDSQESGTGLLANNVTDTQGSVWTLLPSHPWNGSGYNQYVFYAIDAVAGADTVTLNSGGASGTTAVNATAILAAFSGVDISTPIETVGTFATGTGASAAASVTTSLSPTTILGVVSTSEDATGFVATGSPAFTVSDTVNDGAGTASFLEYYGATSTGTFTSSPTWTGSVAWGEEAVAVEGASPLSAGPPTPASPSFDTGQSVTLNSNPAGGSGGNTFQWYSGSSASACTGLATPVSGATLSTYLAAPLSTTYYCYVVTDSSVDSATSPADLVTVNPALTAPAAPTVSATALDVNQPLSVSGTIPSTGTATYAWQWLVSVNAGAYAVETHCGVNSGSGAAGGAIETCTVAASTLIVGDNYALELKVTDSSPTPETATSSPSPTVTVSSTLTAPAAPTVSAPKLDLDQVLTVSGTLPATGSPTYAWQWLVQINAAAYVATTQCAVNSGSGATGGAPETCSVAAGTLTATDTYKFELKVTDSATLAEVQTSGASALVTAKVALTAPAAPTPSLTSLAATQLLTVTDNIPVTGTSTYSWEWTVSINAGAYVDATQCGASQSGAGAAAGALETCTIPVNTLTASTTYNFEFEVTDSATVPEVQTSSASATVTTTVALTAGIPTPTSPTVDNGQSITLTANPSGGTPGYTYQWYSGSTAGGCTGLSSSISGATSMSYLAPPTVATYYCVVVTDTVLNSATSTADLVSVNSALTAPAAPTVSATVVDFNQPLTLTGTIPSTGTSAYQYEWLVSTGSTYSKATMCATPSGNGVAAGAGETCSIAASGLTAGDTYTFELAVNDSAFSPETAVSPASSAVAVSSTLTAPGAPAVSSTKLDVDQALTVTGTIPSTGSPTYSWQWMISINGGAYAAATQCAANGGSGASGSAPETCSIAASALTAGDTYAFKLQVTDGATTPEIVTSGASATVTVKSALTAPAAPTVTATALDYNQALTVTGTVPLTGSSTYSWQWLVSVNGGAFAAATQCAVNSGSGAAGGATETCTAAASTLIVGDNYRFELKVTDTATTPESATSTTSPTVAVSSTLAAPAAPTVGATKLDVDQPLTVTGTIPSTGTATYSWQWQISINAGAYVAATQCLLNSGSGATAGATETCSIAAGSLTVSDTYAFKLKVTDSATTAEVQTSAASATVTVKSALTAAAAPTLSATLLDVNQALTVTGILPSTGTSTYSWQWLVSINGGADVAATQCAANSGVGGAAGATKTCIIALGTLVAGDTYSFELQVTDSASLPEVATSLASPTVTVNLALVAPAAPSPSATALDVDQALTVTDTLTSTGTSTFSWQWTVSINSGAYAAATQCAVGSGIGALGGATETCSVAASTLTVGATCAFKLQVTDSATAAEIQTSVSSATVTVASALTPPGTPAPASTVLDVDQPLTVSGSISSTGTSTYSWHWMISIDGGAYAAASQCGASASGSGASGGAPETCTVPGGTLTAGHSYAFELQVTDSASTGESATSLPSATVTVNSALTAPAAPTASATALDADQAMTVTGTLASTGTPTYSWKWMVEINGGAAVAATQCAQNSGTGAAGGAIETCGIAASSLIVGDTYAFELQVTDSAPLAEIRTSVVSSTVTVSSALTAPGAPTPSASALDVDQALTVSGTIPSTGTSPYSWQWLVSVNGASYAAATQCGVNSGSGAIGGTGETCTVVASTLTVGDTYSFKLQVSDSATQSETQLSAPSTVVTVSSALMAPAAPTPSATALDVDQPLSVTGTIPSSGTSTYSWQWLVSVNGGAFGAAAQCAVSSGVGASAGALESCSIAASTLTVGSNYAFQLQVMDTASVAETRVSASSALVSVTSALTPPGAPVPGSTIVDDDQSLTVPGTIPSTGTSTYAWQWLISVNGGGFGVASQCGSSASGSGAAGGATETCTVPGGTLTAGDSYTFKLQVTDSASTGETQTSPASVAVTVNSALTAPGAPSLSSTKLDVDQVLTVTGTIPSTGTSPYAWQWLISINAGAYTAATQCATSSGSGATAGATETCTIAANSLVVGDTYAFELRVTDGASTSEIRTSPPSSVVPVASSLTAPAATVPSATALDVDQALTVTGTIPSSGTSTYSWQWMVSLNGGGYSAEGQCAVNSGAGAIAGATETCAIPINTLTVGDTYNFELKVTDSASTSEMRTSPASSTVTVKSALTAPVAPSDSATKLDVNQALTITGTIPATGTSTYAWQWMVSVNGGAYAAASQCSTSSGSGAIGGATETCTIPLSTLTVGSTYAFELKATDSATSPETKTSAASVTVTVASALTAPGAPTVSATKLDVDQTLTVTGTIPATGTATYSWQWMVSINGGGFASASQCSTNSGAGAIAGATESCSIAVSTLGAGSTYAFELRVTDSATTGETQTSLASSTVTAKSALTPPPAPTPTATALDVDQGLTVTASVPASGTATYGWQWLISVNGGAYGAATQCGTNSGVGAIAGAMETCSIGASTLTAGNTYAFKLQVTDSATSAEMQTSASSATVSVASALTVPAVPTASATKLDVNQPLSVSGTIPSTGTSTYSWQWMVSVNGGAYAATSQCTLNSGSGAIGGATESCGVPVSTLTVGDTYAFELEVMDSATVAETQTSTTSATVTVSSALTPPGVPVPAVTALDVDQPLVVTGTIPSTGTATYSWQWLESVNAGAYTPATQCGQNSGSGAIAGATKTCSIAASTLVVGDSYSFELKLTDSATSTESKVSAGSVPVGVSSALTAPAAPTPSASALDVDQLLTVTGTIPSTGTPAYSWQWLISVNAGAYVVAAQCGASANGTGANSGGTETCTIPSNTLVAGSSYTFQFQVTDNATSNETQTSGSSSGVPVRSALTAPATPTVTATTLDSDQTLTITTTIPGTGTPAYAWDWRVSVNGAAYAPTALCTTSSGTGASAGDTETCTIVGGKLTAGDTYGFKLRVTDSASTPESLPSLASPIVTVKSPLSAPAAPTPSGAALDADQGLTVTGTVPSSGSSPYEYEWLYSVGVAYTLATMCAVPSGGGALAGAGESCVIPGGALAPGEVYTFELAINDSATSAESQTSAASATVTVASALTAPGAPTIFSNPVVDRGQTSTLRATVPSSGTSPYSWQWLYSTDGGTTFNLATSAQCSTPSGSGAPGGAVETCSFVTTGSTLPGGYKFELQVSDSASLAETQTSAGSTSVTVHTALTAAAAPTPSVTSLDADQPLNVSGMIPSTGTSTYAWQWLVQVGGVGGYGPATQCGSSASGVGASASAVETCNIPGNTLSASTSYSFELRITDSASTHESTTSPASATVTTSSALTAGTPSPTSPTIDLGQSISLGTTASGGSGNNTYQWYSGATATACTSLGSPIGGANSSTYLASPGATTYFCYVVTDSNLANATSAAVALTVNPALTAPAAPTVGATLLDVDQALLVSGTIPTTGSPTYFWSWWVSVDASAFAAATQCAVNAGSGASGGALETCSISPGTLTVGDSYSFKLQVRDSASTAEVQRSLSSPTVAVSSALTAPAAPSPSGVTLDTDQVLTVAASIPSSGTPTYAWQWLVSVNGGAYAAATQCAVINGVGASGGAPETCAIAGGTLTAGDSYAFELQATDTASTHEMGTSSPSPTVAVTPTLTAPAAPTVSAPLVDVDQTVTVTGSIPSTGAPTYDWTWMASIDGGAYAPATQCAVNGGTGASAGALETCSIGSGILPVGHTFAFQLEVTDSASTPESRTSPASSTFAVSSTLSAPGAPSPSAAALDVDQTLTITGVIPTTGTASFSWKWFVAVNGGAYGASTQCAVNGGSGASAGALEHCAIPASTLTVGDTYAFRLFVRDGASTPESQTSAASSAVMVRSALGAPAAPVSSALTLDANQSLTLTGTLPSSGTSPYAWQWMVSVNGGSYSLATVCTVDGGGGAFGSAMESCVVGSNVLTAGDVYSFKLSVTDSASVAETGVSPASPSVSVSSPLGTPSAPTVSARALDVDQVLTVTGFIPLTGASAYAWQWLISINGGPYGPAALCATNGGTGASGGDAESCVLSANVLAAGGAYSFELKVTDSATFAESASSAGSAMVRTSTALVPPAAPTPSATAFNLSRAVSISGTIPTTGTTTYSWQWMISVQGGPFAAATQCGASASGAGAAPGATETCVIPGGTLTASSTYAFKLAVTDSASIPETLASSASSPVVATSPTIVFTPAQGPMGGTYVVTGSGFAPFRGATVAFASSLQTPRACTSGSFIGPSLTTDSSGGFVCSFTIPSDAAGPYSVGAEDTASSALSVLHLFLVTAPAIVVSPSQGAPGSTVTVTGSGFSVSTNLASLVFDSQTIGSCTSGSLTTDGTGAFTCTFKVPDGTSGSSVTVTDSGGQRTSSTFNTTNPASFPWLWVLVAVAAVLVALTALVIARRRRSGARVPKVPAMEGGEPTAPIAAAPLEAAPAYLETPSSIEMPSPSVSAPDYLEEPVGPVAPLPWATPVLVTPPNPETAAPPPAPPTPVPPATLVTQEAPATPAIPTTPKIPATPVVAPPPPADDSMADIDSVLAELDAISGSILKATPKKTTGFHQGDKTSDSTDGGKNA